VSSAVSSAMSSAASVALSTRQSIYHSFFQRELVYLYFQCFRRSKREDIEALAKRFGNVLSFLKLKLKIKTKTSFDEWLPYLNYFYTLIAHVRCEKGEHDLTYMMLFVLYEYFPSLTLQFVHFLIGTNRVQLGCWRDVKYLCDYFYKICKSFDHPVIQVCVSLLNKQLSTDLDRRNREYTPLNNSIRTADEFSTKLQVTDLNIAPQKVADSNLHRYISNVAKWIPREHKKFDWLFTELVLHWFSTYEDSIHVLTPFSLKKKIYRKNVSLLNSMLDTPQIKLCARQTGDIVPKRVSKLTYEKQPCLLYDNTATPRTTDECNTYCREYLTAQYIDADFGNGLFTPLNNSIRTADEFSTKLPVTDLNPHTKGVLYSNLHRYKRKWTHVVTGHGRGREDEDEDWTWRRDTAGSVAVVGFELPIAYYVKEAFSILKNLGCAGAGGKGDADTKFRIQLLNAKWEKFSNKFVELRHEAYIIPLLDISYSMRNMDDETYYTAIGFALLFSQVSVLGKRIMTIDNLPNWINLEKATTFFEMVETFCVNTKSSGSTVPNLLVAVDLIVYSIQKSSIDTTYLDKLQLVFLSDFSSYKNDILDLTMLMDDTFPYSLHKSICRRFAVQYANGGGGEGLDNMPNIVYWNLSKTGFVDLPCSIYEDKTLFLSGFSSSPIGMIMKNKYNNPYKGVCYILQHPKYDVLRETVDDEKHYTFIP